MVHGLSYTLNDKKPFEIRREMDLFDDVLKRLNYKIECNHPNCDAYFDSEIALKKGIIQEIRYL
jgi:hypothetical protein